MESVQSLHLDAGGYLSVATVDSHHERLPGKTVEDEMATKQIPPMDFTGNVSENWVRWKELMELVLAGPNANKWSETHKAAQFLICIGQQGRYMARAWDTSSERSEDEKKILESLLSLKRTARQRRTGRKE